MISAFIRISLILLGLSAGGLQAACEQPVQLAFYDLGVLYNPHTGAGLDRDVADEVFKRIGCSYLLKFESRVRIWGNLERNQLAMSVSGIPNAERRVFADFVPYFWARNQLVYLTRDGQLTTPEAFLANSEYRLGVVKSYRHGAGWDAWIAWLRAQGRVDEVADTQTLVSLLNNRRITAFPALQAVWVDIGERYQMQGQVAHTAWFLDQAKIEHGLVLNKTLIPAALKSEIEKAVSQMRADGSMLKLLKKYFPESVARDMLAP